ncbi:purine permease [Streptomyces tanashiensis]
MRFFPPVVTGTVITLIGVPSSRSRSAGPGAQPHGQGLRFDHVPLLAGITLVVVLLLRRFTRGFLKQVAVLVGLVIGTLIAIPFGVTDFSPVQEADIGFRPPSTSAPRSSPSPRSSPCVWSCWSP